MILNNSSEIVIKNGVIVNDDYTFKSDILIKDGKIIDIAKGIEVKEEYFVLEAGDNYIFPGGIDLDTHFQIHTSADNFNTVCLAALHGGTTTIVDNVEPLEGESLLTAYDRYVVYANTQKYANVALKVCVKDWTQETENDFEKLVKEKGVHILSLKAGQIEDEEALLKLLSKCKQLGCLLHVSGCESPLYKILENEMIKEGITGPEGFLYSHPEEIELSLIGNIVLMAHYAGVPVYVASITSSKTADLIARFRRQGVTVFGETTGYALSVNGLEVFNEDWCTAASVLVNPPLRPSSHTIPTLLSHLASGDLQFVSSKHAAFKSEQKAVGKDDFRKITLGMPGVQERVAIIWEKLFEAAKIDLTQFVALTSSNAAKLLNIFPDKGRIAIGSDADIIICPISKVGDKGDRITNCDVDVYRGVLQHHQLPVTVILAGQILFNNKKASESTRENMLLATACFPDYAFSRLSVRENIKPTPVNREPFELPVNDESENGLNKGAGSHSLPKQSGLEPFCRPPTRSGGRNMQDTTFSLSIDPTKSYPDEPIVASKKGSGYRVNQPPGGATSNLW